MKNVTGILIFAVLLFVIYVSIFIIPKQQKQIKAQIEQLDTMSMDIREMFLHGSYDSTTWVTIDKVLWDDTMFFDIKDCFYRHYQIEWVGDGVMTIQGIWFNHYDSTATRFTITE